MGRARRISEGERTQSVVKVRVVNLETGEEASVVTSPVIEGDVRLCKSCVKAADDGSYLTVVAPTGLAHYVHDADTVTLCGREHAGWADG